MFPAFADFRSAVSIALYHIFVDMSVSAEVMIARESPPTTTEVKHTCIIQFLPLSDTIPFTTRTNSRLAQMQSSMLIMTDGTLAQFFSLCLYPLKKIEHDFPDFNEYVYCFITMMHQRVSNVVFPISTSTFIASPPAFTTILRLGASSTLLALLGSESRACGLYEPPGLQHRVLFGRLTDQGHPSAYSSFDHGHQSRV